MAAAARAQRASGVTNRAGKDTPMADKESSLGSLQLVPGITYHIFPEIAKDKARIGDSISAVLEDEFFGAVQIPPLLDRGTVDLLARRIRLSGITVVYGVGGTLARMGLNLHALERDARMAAVRQAQALIDEAYLLGASIIDLNPARDPGPEHREEAKSGFADSLKRLCEYAQERRDGAPIPISLENFDREVDKRYLLGPTTETLEVIREVKASAGNIGMTPDISHLMLLDEDPAESVALAGEDVLHAHLSNYIISDRSNPRYGDNHPPFWVKDGEVGVQEVARFLQALKNIGYLSGSDEHRRKPLVTFEIRPGGEEPPATVIAGSKRILMMAAALVT